MTAFLLTWKESEWSADFLTEYLSDFRAGETEQRWSCGTTKKISQGDRVFLMKQGAGMGGIFGAGYVVREPFKDAHYNEEKQAAGRTANYIMVRFEHLYDPATDIKIGRSELTSLDDQLWRSQGSGKRIPTAVAERLETLWAERVGLADLPYPEDIPDSELHVEGACKTVVVNAYERDPKARQKCIEHWGSNCSVCGFHFEYAYGDIGRGYIHVHHLKPLSEIRGEYEVDPVNDLRPVCPNCHAMLHRRKIPLSIEELKSRVALYGRR